MYPCHLPLNAHGRYDNNILICKELGLKSIKKFSWDKGVQIFLIDYKMRDANGVENGERANKERV